MPRIPTVKRKDFEKYLISLGCVYKRQKGSHIVYTKRGLSRPIIIVAEKELSFRVVRSCLKTLGITPEEFMDSLCVSKKLN